LHQKNLDPFQQLFARDMLVFLEPFLRERERVQDELVGTFIVALIAGANVIKNVIKLSLHGCILPQIFFKIQRKYSNFCGGEEFRTRNPERSPEATPRGVVEGSFSRLFDSPFKLAST
jgi:hypothetical protein